MLASPLSFSVPEAGCVRLEYLQLRQKELRRAFCSWLELPLKCSGCLLPLAKATMLGTSVFVLDL